MPATVYVYIPSEIEREMGFTVGVHANTMGNIATQMKKWGEEASERERELAEENYIYRNRRT